MATVPPRLAWRARWWGWWWMKVPVSGLLEVYVLAKRRLWEQACV